MFSITKNKNVFKNTKSSKKESINFHFHHIFKKTSFKLILFSQQPSQIQPIYSD